MPAAVVWPVVGGPLLGSGDETRQGVQQLYSQAQVTAEDVAEVITFVLNRPRHLAINEVLLRPAGQL